jgi:hypothetical protein
MGVVMATKLEGGSPNNSKAPLRLRAIALHLRTPVRRKKGRGNVVAETQKAQNRGVPWRAYQLYVHSAKATFAAMYLRQVKSFAAPLWVALGALMGFMLLEFWWVLSASART